MTRLSFTLLALLAASSGCGGSDDTDAGDASTDAGVAMPDAPFMAPDGDGHGPPVTGLGDPCVGDVCISPPTCALRTPSCRTGFCLTDARTSTTAGDYCSIDCVPRACPAGYHCEPISGALPHACIVDPSICGNGIVELGETCDDHNTATGDGCDAACHREPPRPQHLAVDLSISTTEHDLDGGTDHPRVAVSHVESNLDAPIGCGNAMLAGDAGVLGDGGRWESVSLAACPPFGAVDVDTALAYVPGSYDVDTATGSYTLGVCASVQFGDATGCAQRYCAANGITPPSATLTVTANPDGGVHGHFDAHLVPSGDGGCPTVYGPTLDVSGVFDRYGL